MNFSFNPGIRGESWNLETIQNRLTNLVSADRKSTWIRSDLVTSRSSCLGRFFWSVMAKHFYCLRSSCYSVDLAVSQRILQNLGRVIESQHADNQKLILLFRGALTNFETITQGHYLVRFQESRVPVLPPPIIIEPDSMTFSEPVATTPVVIPVSIPVFPPEPIVVPIFRSPHVMPPIYTRHPSPIFVQSHPHRLSSDSMRQIPGLGRGEPVREIAASLQSRGISVASGPSGIAASVGRSVNPVLTVDGRQVPGTGQALHSRVSVASGPSIMMRPAAPVPTVDGRQIPGTSHANLSRPRISAQRDAPRLMPSFTQRINPVPTVGGRQIPGTARGR